MSVEPVPLRAADAIELDLFLEALNRRHHYDFRSYSRASLARRAELARERLGCATLSEVQGRLLHDPAVLPDIIDAMTVQVSELFRDPAYYLALRREVIPHLRTFPSLKVWVAGCADGEELYSLAILFREEGLFDRTMFYATEINRRALARAEAGIYDIDRLPVFSQNYQRAGGWGRCRITIPPPMGARPLTGACGRARCSPSTTWPPTRSFPRSSWCRAGTC